VAVLAAALLAPGCAFRRAVANEWVQGVDKGSIVVGESEWLDVMRVLMLPPADAPEEVGIRTAGRDLIRYATLDSRCFTLGSEAFLLITPFRWCSRRYVYEFAVEFDEHGVVRSAYETTRGNYWPPFQDEDDATPVVTRGLGGTPDP
jgi:hypothetical protein